MIPNALVSKTYEDGSLVPTSAFLGDPILYGDGNANPVAFIEATDWNIKRYRIFGNVFAEIKFNPALRFRSTLGLDVLFTRDKIFKSRLSAAIYDPTSLEEGTATARNLVWNERRKNQRRHRILSEKFSDYLETLESHEYPEEEDDDFTHRSALIDCMEKLSDDNRSLVETRYRDGLEPIQMAEHFNMRADSIRQRLMRIRKALHTCITERLARGSKKPPFDQDPNKSRHETPPDEIN